MTVLRDVAIALVGVILYSTGIVMQKKGSDGYKFNGIRNIRITAHLVLWGGGIILSYVISVIPTGIASKGLPPQIVSAISGLGIIMIIILSSLFLQGRIYPSDLFYTVIIVGCILIACLFQGKQQQMEIHKMWLYILLLLPLLFLIPAFLRGVHPRTKAILFSTISGLMGGMAYILLNIGVKEAGTVTGILGSFYIYMYIIVGFFSGFFLQAAYRFGDIIYIAPIQMSFCVIFPVVSAYFIFNKGISMAQDLSILIIALCCWRILKKH